jgi:hypothetical protein
MRARILAVLLAVYAEYPKLVQDNTQQQQQVIS